MNYINNKQSTVPVIRGTNTITTTTNLLLHYLKVLIDEHRSRINRDTSY